jgi:hypothetical protein
MAEEITPEELTKKVYNENSKFFKAIGENKQMAEEKYYYMECEKCNRHWEVEKYQKTDFCSRCSTITYQKSKQFNED